MLCVQRNTRNGSVSVLLKMPERAQPWSPFGKPLHRFQSPQGNCISVSASLFQHIKCQQPGQMPFSLLYSQEGFCFLWFFSFRCCPFPGRAGSCWTKPRVVQGCSGVRSCCWSSSLDLGLTWFPAGKVVLPVECSCSCLSILDVQVTAQPSPLGGTLGLFWKENTPNICLLDPSLWIRGLWGWVVPDFHPWLSVL